ncbi:MAG: Gfo/Idh/MocA family oxidoreductase [Planctomycetaceae bacterium]|nr:Gfo/Idh/MocA family oxidoreductase [Planctomycetaceae bacterium]
MFQSDALSRRNLLKTTATAAAATSLLNSAVYAAGDETIQVALVGCGGRGTGAADNALSTEQGPVKLVAMADVFEDRQTNSFNALNSRHSERMDVPEERRFIGFDGYQKAMDCLKPGDVVILTTPPAFRWVHYKYAIDKGLNVFMEKPVTVDAPTSRRMLELNEVAKAKGLKVGVGLMCRHCVARGELFDRIQNGEIGDLILLRAYRQAGPTATAFAPPPGNDMTELMYQIRNFHGFLWASGGAYSDFLIHNIDECCWMKNDWPVHAKAAGGRHYRGNYVDQNFDNYSVEYTFADGSKLRLEGRTMNGCDKEFASYAHGSKGSAVISTSAHSPAKSRIYKGQSFVDDQLAWEWGKPEPSPYQLEWEHLMMAIRKGVTYNEVERGVMASAVTSMGRMAAHTGRAITLEEFMAHDHEFAPAVDQLTLTSDAPIKISEKGLYSVPMPGLVTKKEYA